MNDEWDNFHNDWWNQPLGTCNFCVCVVKLCVPTTLSQQFAFLHTKLTHTDTSFRFLIAWKWNEPPQQYLTYNMLSRSDSKANSWQRVKKCGERRWGGGRGGSVRGPRPTLTTAEHFRNRRSTLGGPSEPRRALFVWPKRWKNNCFLACFSSKTLWWSKVK